MCLGLNIRDHTKTKTAIIKNMIDGKDFVCATLACSMAVTGHSALIKGQYNRI